jgi:hypothetical protein
MRERDCFEAVKMYLVDIQLIEINLGYKKRVNKM